MITNNYLHHDVKYMFRKYPFLLTSVNFIRYSDMSRLKCTKRLLRRNSERVKKWERLKKVPNKRKSLEQTFLKGLENEVRLFSCCLCRNTLNGPVTNRCGHTFCNNCLFGLKICNVCGFEIEDVRCLNVLIQNLLDKWREKNKQDSNTAVTEASAPDSLTLLGIEPRYFLRSGYAGLQITDDVEKLIVNARRKRSELMRQQLFYLDSHRDNMNIMLKNIFKDIERAQETSLQKYWSGIIDTDLECILCSRCFFDPVTTGCGHTFCRSCLTRVLDHNLSCPLCMSALDISDYSRESTVVIDQALRILLPKDYKERVLMNLKEVRMCQKNSNVPVFVCTNAFPGVACPLYVYEPRYRLLARRCLQTSTKRFAMAAKATNGDRFVSYGTLLEVKDAVRLQDGRFILTTLGVRRFKVVSRSEQDGYDVAKIQFIRDSAIPVEKIPELSVLHQKVYEKAYRWIQCLKPKVLMEVERLIGPMPKIEHNWFDLPDGPSWTWWLIPILPLSSQLQVGFLCTTSLEKRLRAIDKMLEHMKIRMKALEDQTVTYSKECDASDSCNNGETTYQISLNNTN